MVVWRFCYVVNVIVGVVFGSGDFVVVEGVGIGG